MITGTDIKQRREVLGLKLEDFAHYALISLATLKRWEAGEIRPPDYFERVVQYIERHLDELKAEIKKTSKKRSGEFRVGGSVTERFERLVVKTETDCLVWLGSGSFSLGDGKFVTPRKAAWLIKFNELPAQDVKLKCTTKNCVAWQHLRLGRLADSGKHQVSEEIKQSIRANPENLGPKLLAKKHQVGIGTVYRILEKTKKDEKR